MSHITIIISSKGSGAGLTKGEDDVEIAYTPPDEYDIKQICDEVGKRIGWIQKLPHADAGT